MNGARFAHRVYNRCMPVTSLIPAIISSIIQGAADQGTLVAPAQSSGPVVGLARTLPAESQCGVMGWSAVGSVQINGQVLPLSPAAQIRNQANLIVMPASVQQPVPVRYLVRRHGLRFARLDPDSRRTGRLPLMTKKVFIRTFGCQMNEYDSDKMADVLAAAEDIVKTDNPEDADIILFNTCSVREKAQEKVFHDLGRVRS